MSFKKKSAEEWAEYNKQKAAKMGNRKASQLVVRNYLEQPRIVKKISSCLPSHMKSEQAVNMALLELDRNPTLLDCDQKSIVAVIMEAANLGLYVGSILGHAAIVKFADQAKLIPMYKGMIDLATRSGAVKKIAAHCVFHKDDFNLELGLEDKLFHKPNLEVRDPDKIVCSYAVAVLDNGEKIFEVVPRDKLDQIKLTALNKLFNDKKREDSPWSQHFEEMCRKSAVRRLAKYMPMSPERLQRDAEHPERLSDAERFLAVADKQGQQEQEIIDLKEESYKELEKESINLDHEIVSELFSEHKSEPEPEKDTPDVAKILQAIDSKVKDLMHLKGTTKQKLNAVMGVKAYGDLSYESFPRLTAIYEGLCDYDPSKKYGTPKPVTNNVSNGAAKQTKAEVAMLENLKQTAPFLDDSELTGYLGKFQKKRLVSGDVQIIIGAVQELKNFGDKGRIEELLKEREDLEVI